MSKRFLIILAILAVLFFGIFITTKKKADAPTDGNSTTTQLTNHTYGEGKKSVTLVEYGDFQCPACLRFYPVLQELKAKYKEDITFQFRHFPLSEIHKNAVVSSRAAEAASNQGKFWEMHDKLYENQNAWANSTNPNLFFEDYAQQLALNLDTFRADLKGDQTNRTVQADRAEANKNGYSSTPTFVLDGKQLNDVQASVEYFTQLIDEAIKKKNP